jgi:asparagine synthase (glutamine-hydrolysing)
MSSRTELLESVFGELLPEEVIKRGTKGNYTSPLWTPVAMEFARQWSGEGFDRTLIDPDALRRHWSADERNLLSTTLLQAAWLHDHGTAGT